MAYSTINKSSVYFNTKLYTGNGSTQNITGVGFKPDWIWQKERNGASYHVATDIVRGNTKQLFPNVTASEATDSNYITSFASDGFGQGQNNDTNENNKTYASWNWLAGGSQGSSNTAGSINTTYTSVNTTAGFSISKYVGNDTAGATVGHGLGAVPEMMIVKRLSGSAQHWSVYHKDIGNTHYMQFDTNAKLDDAGVWYDTSPTSTVFTIGNSSKVNGGGGSDSYIAYCFTPKTGYSKFDSYTGNGNANGTFVYTGFKPAFVILKRTNGGTNDWVLYDNKRCINGVENALEPNTANSEATVIAKTNYNIDLLSNGFKPRSDSDQLNGNGDTYIYMAFGQSIVGSNNIPATAR